MIQFVIILSDFPKAHHIEQGYPLVDFVSTFQRHSDIRVYHVSDLPVVTSIETRYLFVALPTSLHKDLLVRIRFHQLYLYDYHDSHILNWQNSDKDWLISVADGYFKTSYYRDQREPLPLHSLPIRLRGVPWLFRNLNIPAPWRRFDVFFLGTPTSWHDEAGPYHQRVEWLQEISGKYRFYGGLTDHVSYPRSNYQDFDNIDALYHRWNRIDFRLYYFAMLQAKIALLPTGHSRWTYRHYEAMSAGCIPLSTDIRQLEVFITFPMETMLIVNDHQSVTSVIDKVLRNLSDYTDWIQINKRHLQTFIGPNGKYSAKAPKAWERFVGQLSST